ncbi:preprotein translocase subunit SecG [Omnitrophica bacterium]|nr:preprotein translocase subunit SecG [Candidatus Omnitrophota bacterium]
MSAFLTVIHVIVCFTLIAVILLQAGKGQGLGGASFGGGNVQSVFGTRAADFMTKATTVAAICFLLTSIGLDVLEVKKSKSLLDFSRKESSIDMDTIQKALETVKAEDAVAENADKAGAEAETVAEGTTEEATELPKELPAQTSEAETPVAL